MDPDRLFEELVAVARKLDVDIRIEAFATPPTNGGGLCTLAGRNLILVDQYAPVSTRLEVLVRALARFDTEAVYITPEAREVLSGCHAHEPLPDRGQNERKEKAVT